MPSAASRPHALASSHYVVTGTALLLLLLLRFRRWQAPRSWSSVGALGFANAAAMAPLPLPRLLP
jgi:hypothetical protein